MPRWRSVVAALVALGGIVAAPALAAGPVQLTAAFDRGARLGGSTAMEAELRIDPHRAPSPVTAVRVLYPRGLGLVSSGLGLAACTRPQRDFQQVLVSGPALGGCPRNAVLGYGSALAEVRFLDGQVVPELATMTVLAGPLSHGTLRLVAYVDGYRPFGARLAYAGELLGASGSFGGALAMRLPAITSIADLATVALVRLRVSIGSRRIVYTRHRGGRTIAYHPGGIGLPDRCPHGGFRFRVQLTFEDGGHGAADATVGCSRVR